MNFFSCFFTSFILFFSFSLSVFFFFFCLTFLFPFFSIVFFLLFYFFSSFSFFLLSFSYFSSLFFPLFFFSSLSSLIGVACADYGDEGLSHYENRMTYPNHPKHSPDAEYNEDHYTNPSTSLSSSDHEKHVNI